MGAMLAFGYFLRNCFTFYEDFFGDLRYDSHDTRKNANNSATTVKSGCNTR